MKKLKPSKKLFDSFLSYRRKDICTKCKQSLPKEKRKKTPTFYLIRELKNGLLRVQMEGRKTLLTIHKDFFIL